MRMEDNARGERAHSGNVTLSLSLRPRLNSCAYSGNATLWNPAWGPKEPQQYMYVRASEIHDHDVDVIRSSLSAHKALRRVILEATYWVLFYPE